MKAAVVHKAGGRCTAELADMCIRTGVDTETASQSQQKSFVLLDNSLHSLLVSNPIFSQELVPYAS